MSFDPETYAGSVMATARGYHGGKRREPGEAFVVAAGEFSASWMEPKADAPTPKVAKEPGKKTGDGGKAGNDGTGDGAGQDGKKSLPDIPPDWKTMHHKKRLALAKELSGIDAANADAADEIIAAEVANRDAAAMRDLQKI